MNNKGFTLIEIISTISILLLIAVIAIPSAIGMVKKVEEKNYNNLINTIKSSSEMFVERYRSDIPFNNGKYYFNLKTLAHLNLLKTPIINPKTKNEIDLDTCVEVIKNDDGSLDYNYQEGNKSCIQQEGSLILELKDNVVIKKGTKLKDGALADYVVTYGSTITPYNYLKLEIPKSSEVDTNRLGTQTVTYTLVDILRGTSLSKNLTIRILKDQNVNLVMLTDKNTREDFDKKDLTPFKKEIEDKLTSAGEYKDIGIKYNVDITKLNTSGSEIEQGKIVDFSFSYCNYIYYNGLYNNMIVAEGSGGSDCIGGFKLVDLTTGEILLDSGFRNCRYNSNGNIYCHKYDGWNSTCCIEGKGCYSYSGKTIKYYEYIKENEKYNLNTKGIYDYVQKHCRTREKEEYTPSKSTYSNIKSNYDNSSSDWNTHTNPNGLTYPSSSEFKNIILSIPGMTTKKSRYYKIDEYQNMFYDEDKGIGFLSLYRSGNNYNHALIIWQTPEKFSIDFNNYDGYDKTYFIIIANSTTPNNQKLDIKNLNANIKTYVFADTNTLNKFNITNSTERDYTNIDDILNQLKILIN